MSLFDSELDVPVPIRDNGDTSIMFNVVAQSPPPNTIEMYC